MVGGDTLFYLSTLDEQFVGSLNIGLKTTGRDYPWVGGAEIDPDDPFDTTILAVPHIASDSYKVAKRYVRCYELLEHGFYTEAFIVAFSILDDLVQQMLDKLLSEKGMGAKDERESLLRGIKESRLKLFLGPLLKVIYGKDISTLWPASAKALNWLNTTRNNIAHSGGKADHTMAAKAIYVCIKTLVVLHQEKLIDAEFSLEFFRHAKITAAWTVNPPDWLPKGEVAESMDFNS
jgi:hypothetical protein